MGTSPEHAIIRRAAGQRLLVTRRQAMEAGLSARQIRYRVASGGWRQVRPSVYAVDGRAPAAWDAAVLAAVLAIPGAVASHRTALWLHGVKHLGTPGVIEVSVAVGTRARLPGVRVRQHRNLPPHHRTAVGEVPATTCERAVVDVAGELETVDRLALLEEALTTGAAERLRFVRTAEGCANGRAGVRQLLDAAGEEGAPRFRSWLEAEAARTWRAAGLPAPRWNVVLRDERGRIGEVDALFPGEVVVELDGLRFHLTPAQRRRDAARDRRLALSGRIVLRYSWQDLVHRPDAVVAEIRQALAAGPR